MSPSKLDARAKARDFRRKKRKHRKPPKPDEPITHHVDVTSVVFASQQPDVESRFIVLDTLPDMDEEWIDRIIYVRSASGAADRAYLGVQAIDDSLAWIELSLAAPAPPSESNEPEPPPEPGGITFIRHYGVGVFGAKTYNGSGPFAGVARKLSNTQLWSSDPFNQRIFALDTITGARGLTITTHGAGAVAVNPVNGDICVNEERNGLQSIEGASTNKTNRIRVYSSTGSLKGTIDYNNNLVSAEGMDVNDAGTHAFVAEGTNEIVKRCRFSDYSVLSSWTTGVVAPQAVYCTPDDTVLVSMGFQSNQLKEYSETGTLLRTIGTESFIGLSTDGNFTDPSGMFVDSLGRLFVVDQGNDRIQILDWATGAFIDKFGTSGTGDGQFSSAYGIDGEVLDAGAYTRVYIKDQPSQSVGLAPRISVWDIDASVV